MTCLTADGWGMTCLTADDWRMTYLTVGDGNDVSDGG